MDSRVLATDSPHNYFAYPEFEPRALAPKTIGDGRTIRARLLRAFKEAERARDPRGARPF